MVALSPSPPQACCSFEREPSVSLRTGDLRRGEAEVLKQNRLRDFNVSSDGAVVMAVASGSQSYTVQLDLHTQPPSCNCNCPSGRGHPDRVCKHSLGLLLWRCEQLSLGAVGSDQGIYARLNPCVSLVWVLSN